MVNAITNFFYSVDKKIYFVFFCLLYAFTALITEEFLFKDEIYYNAYSEQLSIESMRKALLLRAQWQWLGYTVIPFAMIVKFSVIALCLNIGCFVINVHIPFKRLFQICLISESVFMLPSIIKIIWFWKFQPEYTLDELVYFVPFSLLNFFDIQKLQKWFVYPLQVISIFEILYWFIISYGLKLVLKRSFYSTLKVVLSSYGIGLLIWVTLFVFIQLSFS